MALKCLLLYGTKVLTTYLYGTKVLTTYLYGTKVPTTNEPCSLFPVCIDYHSIIFKLVE